MKAENFHAGHAQGRGAVSRATAGGGQCQSCEPIEFAKPERALARLESAIEKLTIPSAARDAGERPPADHSRSRAFRHPGSGSG